MSGVDLVKVVGHRYPDKPVSWNKRDLLIYAVGVGAKKEDFPFVYGALSYCCVYVEKLTSELLSEQNLVRMDQEILEQQTDGYSKTIPRPDFT